MVWEETYPIILVWRTFYPTWMVDRRYFATPPADLPREGLTIPSALPGRRMRVPTLAHLRVCPHYSARLIALYFFTCCLPQLYFGEHPTLPPSFSSSWMAGREGGCDGAPILCAPYLPTVFLLYMLPSPQTCVPSESVVFGTFSFPPCPPSCR